MRLLETTWLKATSMLAGWVLLLLGGAPPAHADQPKPLYGVVVSEPAPKPAPPETDKPDVIPDPFDDEEEGDEGEKVEKEQPCVYGPPPAEPPQLQEEEE